MHSRKYFADNGLEARCTGHVWLLMPKWHKQEGDAALFDHIQRLRDERRVAVLRPFDPFITTNLEVK